jgi:hypothetical protein
MSKSLRQEMPWTAGIIDDLRQAMGTDAIDGQIRKGMKGQPTFWASEKGHEIGTRNPAARSLVSWDDRGISYSFDVPAGASIEEELEIRRAALVRANARVFNRFGQVAEGEDNAAR